MYSKMAFSNVKKSFKDFTIYFLTLAFGVCLFYMFNSLQSQQAMLMLTERQELLLQLMTGIMSGISVFVAFILGFLILYANSFLVRRRKKELGLYMLLGMEQSRISRILLLETLFIGVFALAAGLGVGILVSQGLSILTATLFVVEMEEFRFVFSSAAFIKSILYFGLMFLIVIVLNNLTISRFKLIDLLTAHKQSEKTALKNIWISFLLFLVSLGCLGLAYYLIIDNGLMTIDASFTAAILLGLAGTFLFFFSLSGFLLKILESAKGIYLHGLNMFVLRQINSRITTTFISMSIICLMLFLAIGVLSTGAGLATSMTTTLEKLTPYNATISCYPDEYPDQISFDSTEDFSQQLYQMMLDENIPYMENIEAMAAYTLYRADQTNGEELYQYLGENENFTKVAIDNLQQNLLQFIRLSEYNQALLLQEKEPLELEDYTIAISSNTTSMFPTYEKLLKENGKLSIDGKEYQLYPEILDTTIETIPMAVEMGFLIVPDDAVIDCSAFEYRANIQFDDTIDGDAEEAWLQAFSKALETTGIYRVPSTRSDAYNQQNALSAVFAYIAIYLGIVFLISCAAVLALQQLSESSDNIQRYQLLDKIGTSKKDISKALFMQICISFCVPLVLALVHAAVGISVMNKVISMFSFDSPYGLLASAAGILLIYGGYMIITYLASLGMLKKQD